MKQEYLEPEMEIERVDDVIDCLTISPGDHDESGNSYENDQDT